MRYWLMLAALLLMAGCAATPQADERSAAPGKALLVPPAAAGVCRIGPNDGPVLAERGIGGTGMPGAAAPVPSGTKLAPPAGQDRGVGGTGMSGPVLATAGIAGEITGFASICVNGVEVQYNAATPITADGAPTRHETLRAGQIVAIAAARERNVLQAQRVEIRHEVVGPLWAVAGRDLIIAGQRVMLTNKTLGSMGDKAGWWLAVSGLRNMSGVIVASRVDAVPAGQVVVHGTLRGGPGQYRIGALRLRITQGDAGLRAGDSVTVAGRLAGGVLQVVRIAPDLLYQNPEAYFGATANWFLLEAYSTQGDGMIELAGGMHAPSNVQREGSGQGPAVFSFTRGAGGGLLMQGDWAPHNVPAPPGMAPAAAGMGGFAGLGNMPPVFGQMSGLPGGAGIGAMPRMGGYGGGFGAVGAGAGGGLIPH